MNLKIVCRRSKKGGDFLLCTEDGEPLPGQRAMTIVERLGEATVVTVEFVVTGKRLWLEESASQATPPDV